MVSTDLLILHGVNGCRSEMQPWRSAFADDFDSTRVLNLAGHGGRRLPDHFTMAGYAEDLLGQMDQQSIERPVLLGYSFGGIVALYLARHFPDRVHAVVTVASQWQYDETAIKHVTHLLQVPRLTALAHRREHLARVHHPNDWRSLVERLNAMYTSFAAHPPLTPDDLARIDCPCLVLSGSTDPITSVDETVALHRGLAGSEVALYEGRAHPAEQVPTAGLHRAVMAWAGRHLVTDAGEKDGA
jgi:pimeloyl-ACP methyl ester carboxylesterase